MHIPPDVHFAAKEDCLEKIVDIAAGATNEAIGQVVLMDPEDMSVTGLILGINLKTLDHTKKRELKALMRLIEKVSGVRLKSL